MGKNKDGIIKDRVLNSGNIIQKMDEFKNYLVDLSALVEGEDSRILEGLRIISFAQDQIESLN
jgi:hypothetical protein